MCEKKAPNNNNEREKNAEKNMHTHGIERQNI